MSIIVKYSYDITLSGILEEQASDPQRDMRGRMEEKEAIFLEDK